MALSESHSGNTKATNTTKDIETIETINEQDSGAVNGALEPLIKQEEVETAASLAIIKDEAATTLDTIKAHERGKRHKRFTPNAQQATRMHLAAVTAKRCLRNYKALEQEDDEEEVKPEDWNDIQHLGSSAAPAPAVNTTPGDSIPAAGSSKRKRRNHRQADFKKAAANVEDSDEDKSDTESEDQPKGGSKEKPKEQATEKDVPEPLKPTRKYNTKKSRMERQKDDLAVAQRGLKVPEVSQDEQFLVLVRRPCGPNEEHSYPLQSIRIPERLIRAGSPVLSSLLDKFFGNRIIMNEELKVPMYENPLPSKGKKADKSLHIESLTNKRTYNAAHLGASVLKADFQGESFWILLNIWARYLMGRDLLAELFKNDAVDRDFQDAALKFYLHLGLSSDFEKFINIHRWIE